MSLFRNGDSLIRHVGNRLKKQQLRNQYATLAVWSAGQGARQLRARMSRNKLMHKGLWSAERTRSAGGRDVLIRHADK
jgi:hypothetical protein